MDMLGLPWICGHRNVITPEAVPIRETRYRSRDFLLKKSLFLGLAAHFLPTTVHPDQESRQAPHEP